MHNFLRENSPKLNGHYLNMSFKDKIKYIDQLGDQIFSDEN